MKVRKIVGKIARFFILIALLISFSKSKENGYPNGSVTMCGIALIYYIFKVIFIEEKEEQSHIPIITDLIHGYCVLGDILVIFVVIIFTYMAIKDQTFQCHIILKVCYAIACTFCGGRILKWIWNLTELTVD